MTDGIDSQFIQKMFPTLNEMTYLNNAATGIPPVVTLEAISQYLVNRTKAIGTIDDTLRNIKEIRTNLANLLGGEYTQYGLVPNTSTGVNAFGHAVTYEKGSNIVICDIEFPANYIPWQNICRIYGLELRVVKSQDGAVGLDDYKAVVDDRTRILAVSHVQFGTGFKSDIAELAKIVHERGGYLLTDIIQSAGWSKIDLKKMNVDFATAQAAKWLIGPIGAGFCYLREDIVHELQPKFLGWWGVKQLMEFSYSERKPLEDARMFQIGSPSMMAYVGFRESLNVLLEIPSKQRESFALENGDYLRKRLEEEGIEFYKFSAENNSPIVSCAPDNIEELQKELRKNNVFCSVRNGRLRVSPHFYNTKSEIDKMIDIMRK